ncbi:MAG: recombination mediator RecR [Sphaerochaetaceae bacterium]|nr:recombination mediator RecR [Sphaerochaetaceae bacterium]MDC7237132.1 recombination mediator RecR [Sphaerochaetaceae bacterium]MDC7242800.1 recombination mediator RecR [Sphaerochaetaceae bacterium]MDC7249355.1 recombination mediator RecR [Sphaerochaetaceae bacterium]
MSALEDLIEHLSRLPSIGPKTASRLAYHLIKTDNGYNKLLGEEIATIQDKIFPCSICGSFTETDPCPICTSSSRDHSTICVVEQPQDVVTLLSSGVYDGMFHVLGGAISPIDGIGVDQLNFAKLIKRLKEGSFKELIIATNPTEEGDTTALYLRQILKDSDIQITRLASGLPIGGDIEYADKITVARSLRGRIKF